MRLATELWNKGDVGHRQIAKQFNMPWSPLRDRIAKNRIITGAKNGFAGMLFDPLPERSFCLFQKVSSRLSLLREEQNHNQC